MAKDLRATRDYMRDKRAGTLDGRKWTDYKSGGSEKKLDPDKAIKELTALKWPTTRPRSTEQFLNGRFSAAIRFITRVGLGKRGSSEDGAGTLQALETRSNELDKMIKSEQEQLVGFNDATDSRWPDAIDRIRKDIAKSIESFSEQRRRCNTAIRLLSPFVAANTNNNKKK